MTRPRYQSSIQRTPYKARDLPMTALVRGMVVRVIAADAVDQGDVVTPPQPLCDVLLARGGIVRAPVLQRGSSIQNGAYWTPAPARTNLVTGAAVKIEGDQLAPQPARLEDLDGEMVLVAFMEGDLDRPVIVGSYQHPRTPRRINERVSIPTVAEGQGNDPRRDFDVQTRAVTHQGTVAALDRGGNVRLDLRRAGVANDGRTYDANGETAGVVDVALRRNTETVIRAQDGVPILRIMVGDDDEVSFRVGREPNARVFLAGPLASHLDGWWSAIDALGQTVAALWPSVMTAAASANASGAPVPVQIAPGAIPAPLPFAWVPPAYTGAVQSTLEAKRMQIDGDTVG